MKPLMGAAFVLLLANSQLHGQRKLSKAEILSYCRSEYGKVNQDTFQIVDSDPALEMALIGMVDSLTGKGIDSIVICSTALPGYISGSTCDTGLFPITTHIIWMDRGVTTIKKIRGRCPSEIVKDSTLHLFDFYGEDRPKLDSETFMPVIMGGQLNKNGSVSYSMSSIDHEPYYSFYFKIGNDSRAFHFCQSYLENKVSLFWKDNLALSAYRWWELLQHATHEVN